jgi:hypothetical protein
MPQSEVLGGHRGPRAKEGDEGRQKGSSQAEYAERVRAENEPEGPARGAQEALSAEAPMPPSGRRPEFWRGTRSSPRTR